MLKTNKNSVNLFLIYIPLSWAIACIGFVLLFKTNIINLDEKPKVADILSTFIALSAAVASIITVMLASKSIRLTERSEEGSLYLKMMERYSSQEMADALRCIGKFKEANKSDIRGAIADWKTKLVSGDPKAVEIENARHLIKYFYRDVMQMYQARFFSKELTKRILNPGGRYLFNDIILEMEVKANPLQFEKEFYPFKELFNEINKELVPVSFQKKKICLIPARQDATRFNDKLLQILKDPLNKKEKTVIRETYERMASYKIFDDVFVVTNSAKIKLEIEAHGGKVIFIEKNHASGTDRIAEAAKDLDADVIFNVQGDEPFIDREPLVELLDLMDKSVEPLLVTSLMKEMHDDELIKSSDYVKVVCDNQANAIFFSRSMIPYPKKSGLQTKYYEHVGVYAFTREALIKFTELAPSKLEQIESVECLRFTENQIPIKMVKTTTFLLEIDTPEDLEKVNTLLAEGRISLV